MIHEPLFRVGSHLGTTCVLKFLAFLLPCSIIASLIVRTHEVALWPAMLPPVFAAGIAVIFLARAYASAAELRNEKGKRLQTMIRAHIVLHGVPVAYLATAQAGGPSTMVDLWWLIPLAGFFYTGRRAWSGLFEAYRSTLYFMFLRGNTGVLVMMPVLLIAGTLFQIPGLLQRVLGIYFVIHFMLIGISVLKIERDIASSS